MHSEIAKPLTYAGLFLLLASCDQKPTAATSEEDGWAGGSPSRALVAAAGLSASAVSMSQINLAWQDNATNESGFEIHRATGAGGSSNLLTTTGANVTSYGDPGLSAGTQYCYTVRAFRTTGRKTTYAEYSGTACATTPAPPPSPSPATARPVSSSAVGIAWMDNSATENGFRVERSATVAGPWATIATTAPNVTSARDEGRANEQQVCYRVIAFNAWGDSEPSNADCTTPPAAPTSLTAASAPQGIDLTWVDHSAVEELYEIQRSSDGVTFTAVAWLAASVTRYRDAEAITNQTYWYQVRAWKDNGFSDPSNVASAVGSCVPTGEVENVCDDGADNDCDGFIDSYDSDCGVFRCDFDFCPSGMVCGYDGICVSHCNDGGWNGDEGDVDCGGACSTKCQAGQHCWGNFDCASGVCVSDVCQPGGTP